MTLPTVPTQALAPPNRNAPIVPTKSEMSPEQAIETVLRTFPFPGYATELRECYRNIAVTVLRHLERGSSVLDFGCGPCDKTAIVQLLGFKCTGYDDLSDYWHAIQDNRDKILQFARETNIDFRLAGEGGLPFAANTFDMLMLHDVIEHLHDSPRNLLNDLLELVKPRGLLVATVPNAANIRKRLDLLRGRTNYVKFEIFYWHPDPWRGHVREYVKDDLKQLAEYLGLDIIELKGCDHMLYRLPTKLRRLYLNATMLAPGWKDTLMLVARKRDGWKPRKMLSPEELKAILQTNTTYQY